MFSRTTKIFKKPNIKELTLSKIFLSMIFFTAIWEIGNIIGWNPVFDGLKNWYGNNLYRIAQRVLMMCVPCFVLIEYYGSKLKVNMKAMFRNFNFSLFYKWCLGVVLLEMGVMLIVLKRFNINIGKLPTALDLLTVGLAEELLFRGWIFNSLYSKVSYKKANLLQSLFFVIFHWVPFITSWVIAGSIDLNSLQYVVTYNTLTVFVGGLVFGYLFKKTESITFVALIHALLDYCAILFYMS